MAQKLKIYACSGVGDAQEQEITGYWLDDTKTLSNRQAVNNLLTMVNLQLAILNDTSLSNEEKVSCYDSIDFLVVSLRLAQRYQDEVGNLIVAGNVLRNYLSNFNFESIDDKARGEHLDNLYSMIISDVDNGTTYQNDEEFTGWWKENVVDLNKVGLSKEQQLAIERANDEGVGATISGDLNTYLSDAKSYFLYTFIPDNEVKGWPKVIQDRRKKQLEIYNYCLPVYKELNGTEASMQRIIRSSIYNTFKLSPEAVLRRIKEGKAKDPYSVNGVGDFGITEAVATIIAAVISAVVAIISSILACVGQVYAAKYTVPEDAYMGIPEDSDFDSFKGTGNTMFLWIGAALLGLVFLANGKKGKRKK